MMGMIMKLSQKMDMQIEEMWGLTQTKTQAPPSLRPQARPQEWRRPSGTGEWERRIPL